MDNAEEVMQLLEEFSKIKPKDIPRELEDYLGYVAKTGDPVYQWSLVRSLFREKLLSVITDFYESTLTVELPPCPNVEPFNYDRMKTSLLERFDSFSGAPFTIQRICELLINPRKEYNRADKYMRAIEKNILVVSTREPGTGKRPLECDQTETVLNGMPDAKFNESDGSILHGPTDLPYLGAPPASNDVTVETTEPSSGNNDMARPSLELGLDGEFKTLKPDSGKQWSDVTDEETSVQESDHTNVGLKIKPECVDVSLNIEDSCSSESDCDTNTRLSSDSLEHVKTSPEKFEGEGSANIFRPTLSNETVLPDSIDSSDSSQESSEALLSFKLLPKETESVSDENEVSSSPAVDSEVRPNLLSQEEIDGTSDSEAEVSGSSLLVGSGLNAESRSPDDDDNSSNERVIQDDDTKLITISEVTASKSDEIDLECNEITGVVMSPISPESNLSVQIDDSGNHKVNLETIESCDQPDSCPDSSNDVSLPNKDVSTESCELKESDVCSEADSVSETKLGSPLNVSDLEHSTPDQTNEKVGIIEDFTGISSPSTCRPKEVDCIEKPLEDPLLTSDLSEEISSLTSQNECSDSRDSKTTKLIDVQSTSGVVEEMYDQERREESVIHSASTRVPDSNDQITVDEINVDPICESEEAMDVDDCSNQMMISEGENEGEPMDQSDQLQS